MVVGKKAADKKISFEEAIARLETLVQEMEDSRLPLEQALEMFTEGVELAGVCDKYLAAAEQRIALLTANDKDEIELKEIDALPSQADGRKIEF